MTPHWHMQTVAAVLKAWSSAHPGREGAAARERLQAHGPNELRERRGRGAWRMLAEQFAAAMVLILMAAGAISALLGKFTEAAAILAIVVLFAVLGFLQEFRAERAMAALRRLAAPVVTGDALALPFRGEWRAGGSRVGGGGPLNRLRVQFVSLIIPVA